MSVGRICVRGVDFANPQESAWQVAERMHDRAVGTLIVQDEHGRPCGILTDRDLVERVIVPRRNPDDTLVSEIMTPNPISVAEDASIETAVALMRSGGFRRLPVGDHNDMLIGIVSLDDVLSLLAEEFVAIGELLKKQSPPTVVSSVL